MQIKSVKSRGSALISALFIMTLVAIAATAMSMRLQLDIYRTRMTIENDKLSLASELIAFWSIDRLFTNDLPQKALDHQGTLMLFPKKYQYSYPGVTLQGRLIDLQAFFNINNVGNRIYHLFFLKLLEKTAKKLSPAEGKDLLSALQYWITPHQMGRGQDKELTYYLRQKPPYLPGFQSLQSITEFRLIRSVRPRIYQALLPMLTALPSTTPVNIKTAPLSFIMSLGNGLTAAQAQEIIRAREKFSASKPQALTALLQKFDIPADQITLESEYFLSIAKASTPDLSLITYSIWQCKREKNKVPSINLISQSMNTL